MMCASKDTKFYIPKKGKGAIGYDLDDLVLVPPKGTKAETPIQKKHTLKSYSVKEDEGPLDLETISSWRKHTLWSYYFKGNVEIPEICVFSISSQCPDEKEGCSRLHAKKMMHWQLFENKWFNLHMTQSDQLERAFQDVEKDEVVIPPINTVKHGLQGQNLIKFLGTDSWRADFRQMKLENLHQTKFFRIRRLSTPSKEMLKSKYATEFRWYYLLESQKKWIEFGQEEDHKSDFSEPKAPPTTSSEIEKHFLKGQRRFMTVSVAHMECELDFTRMELTLGKYGRTLPMRRRPKCIDNIQSTWRRHTVWSYYSSGDVEVPEICTHSLNLECPEEDEGCRKLHARKKWHWQILKDEMWFNLLIGQSDCLEKAFLNVEMDEVLIPSIDPTKTGNLGQRLMKILGTDSLRADFKQMKLFRLKKQGDFDIRRLSTPSTEYRWFYKEKEETWVEFVKHSESSKDANTDNHGFKVPSYSSTEIEKLYQKNQRGFITVKVKHMECKLYVSEMQLECKTSGKVLPVRRRPISDVKALGIWFHHIQGNVQIPEICLVTDKKGCEHMNGCGRLHSKKLWHWQFSYGGNWYNMTVPQGESLEKEYHNDWRDTVELKERNLLNMGKRGEELQKILGETKWHVEFDTMSMTNSGYPKTTLKIRRLSIPVSSVENNGYVWYFIDENGIGVELGPVEDADEMHPYVSPLTSSYDIEKCYQSGKMDLMSIIVPEGCFELSFSSMTLRNKTTQKIMQVQRQPQGTLSDRPNLKFKENVTVVPGSKEYKHLARLILSMHQAKIDIIKQIQNPQLQENFKQTHKECRARQGKKKRKRFENLYQWIALEFIDEVCRNKFRWEHQCPEVRELYGKNKMVFFKSAKFVHETCSSSPSERNHRLFVFNVLVRNDEAVPEGYVLCDEKEYIPEYMIKF